MACLLLNFGNAVVIRAFTHSSPPVPGEVFVKLLKISIVLKFLQYSRKISPGLQMNQGIFLCALMCSVPLICCFGWSHLPWDVARAHSERKFSLIRCGIKTLVSKLLQQEKIKSTEEVTVRTHEAQDSGFSEAYLRINLLKNKVLLKNCCLDPVNLFWRSKLNCSSKAGRTHTRAFLASVSTSSQGLLAFTGTTCSAFSRVFWFESCLH